MASLIPILSLIFLLFTTFNHLGEARSIIVGGTFHSWKVPEPSNNTLNNWAESIRFRIGDVLEFYYDAKSDSVLEVTKENYESCNTEKPIKEHKDEVTNVKLDVSGPHYFISGAPTGNCRKGEKLVVVVQSPNHPPMPKPGPGPAAAPPNPSAKPPSSPVSPVTPAPAPAPAKNAAVGLVAGYGIFWAFVAVIGLAWA